MIAGVGDGVAPIGVGVGFGVGVAPIGVAVGFGVGVAPTGVGVPTGGVGVPPAGPGADGNDPPPPPPPHALSKSARNANRAGSRDFMFGTQLRNVQASRSQRTKAQGPLRLLSRERL